MLNFFLFFHGQQMTIDLFTLLLLLIFLHMPDDNVSSFFSSLLFFLIFLKQIKIESFFFVCLFKYIKKKLFYSLASVLLLLTLSLLTVEWWRSEEIGGSDWEIYTYAWTEMSGWLYFVYCMTVFRLSIPNEIFLLL